MADVKISGLPASTTPLAGTEVLPIVQGGVTKQVSVANLTAGFITSEQGNWTPIRTGFAEVLNAGSITSSGWYTKVGNTVTVQAQIVCAGGATISATSGIGSYLKGLPFVPMALGAGEWVNGSSVADQGSMLVHTNINMYLTKGWVASSSAFYFSATYLAS